MRGTSIDTPCEGSKTASPKRPDRFRSRLAQGRGKNAKVKTALSGPVGLSIYSKGAQASHVRAHVQMMAGVAGRLSLPNDLGDDVVQV